MHTLQEINLSIRSKRSKSPSIKGRIKQKYKRFRYLTSV
ncbi:hypothetical protein TcasGA2_TC034608 [Tribolium castaneum]|uniref:Uncharacterized protein n=1 Tax=Tribolium castaneum TaxID=7070 RepID=A0A139WKE5_TRICA|nr:hypothetical protein TcasGA2_TC034608 [Tribolium castaneum]